MSGTLRAALPSAPVTVLAAQIERSRRNLWRFAVLAVQLGLLLLVFDLYGLESRRFLTLSSLIVGGFIVSYWLPFRFKEPFYIALSLGGAFLLLDPAVAGLLIGAGGILFAIVRSGLAFRWRVVAILAFGILCA
jgi:hypothetical protein